MKKISINTLREQIINNNNKEKIKMSDILDARNILDDFKDENGKDILYALLKLPVVNLHMYDEDKSPEWVTIGHKIVAHELAEEFNLTPGKPYVINGIGGDLVQVCNDIGENDTYSVEYFTHKLKSVV